MSRSSDADTDTDTGSVTGNEVGIDMGTGTDPSRVDVGGVVGSTISESLTSLQDDLEVASALQLGHVRLTVPWATAQPKPGILDGGTLEMVQATAQAVRANGGRLWLCLLSPDVPRWFDDEGGFADESAARHWWPRWVEAIANGVGDDVDGWVPFEAPYAMANRLERTDPRRHGNVVDTLLVAWRDAWRLLHGPHPIATSLDVRTVVIPRNDVVAAELARREAHLRWHTWLRALRDGTITIPGRADRELADLAGSCDQLGIAVSGSTAVDLEPLLHRTAEEGPGRPLAITFRPTGPDRDARGETVDIVTRRAAELARSFPLARITFTDLDAVSVARG